MNRREFLRTAGLVGGAATLGGPGLIACGGGSAHPTSVARLPLPRDSVLAHPATECPIDTVLILMMENRQRYATPSFRPWLEYTNVRNVPQLPDDRPC